MNPEQLKSQIRYALEKAGKVYNPNRDYTLTTPKGVAAHLANGKVKLASFEPYYGEKLVIMGGDTQ